MNQAVKKTVYLFHKYISWQQINEFKALQTNFWWPTVYLLFPTALSVFVVFKAKTTKKRGFYNVQELTADGTIWRKIRKPDKILENKIIISYVKSKQSTLGSGHYFGFVRTKIWTRRDIAKIKLPAESFCLRKVFKNILSTKYASCEKWHKRIKNT